jgi:tetratricopeptide (TPR) repeat protein
MRRLGAALSVVAAVVLVASACSGDAVASAHAEGVRHFDEGRWEDAITAFSEVVELEPTDQYLETAIWNRSIALFELGRLEEALADETFLIELEPTDSNALALVHLNRSRELIALGRPEEALIDVGMVIELQPTDSFDLAKAHLNGSIALYELGRFEEAVDAAAAAMTAHSSSDELLARAHRRKYLSYIELSNASGVLAETTAVIELDSNNDLGSNNVERLAEAYYLRAAFHAFIDGEVAEAEADLRKALALLPEDHKTALAASVMLAELVGTE